MVSIKLVVLLLTTTSLNGLMFDSMEHMKALVVIEQHLEDALDNYIKANYRDDGSLERVHEFAELIHRDIKVVKEQGSQYLDSPINSYLIIKRFTDGWSKLNTILKEGEKYEELMDILNSSNGSIPTGDNKDFFGAVSAILRLQNTYNITARSILEGRIPGCQVTTPLTADDAYEFGSAAYKGYQFMRSKEWINEGIRLAKEPGYEGSTTMAWFLEYLSWLEYITGDNKQALEVTRQIVRLAPNDPKHQSNELQYRHLVERQTPISKSQIKAKNETNSTLFFMNSTYTRLCQGLPVEVNYTHDTSQLKCWYHGRHDPRLRIGPMKVEQISVKPKIYIFRKFASEYEVTRIKEIATPMLSRATVFNPDTGKLDYADYRVAKSAWLSEKLDNVIGRINRRASTATGLNKGYAEELQVGNYGMGGQYETHVDFGDPGTPIERDPHMGNRIATLLIYLNEVPYGGATVFPEAGIQVLPSKLDAVFWFNLKRSGEGDYTTLHAGCPVLCGNKWVANKWFRINGNLFSRPCALDKNT